MLAPVPRPRAVQGFRESENAATGCEARTITNHEDTMPAVYKATKPDGSARLIVANNRNPFLASPIKLGQQRDLVGAIVEIQYGIDSLIRFDAAKVNNYRLDPQEGGTVTISFRVQVSGIKDIDAGRLCGLIGHEVTISVDPPTATDPIHEDEQMAGAY